MQGLIEKLKLNSQIPKAERFENLLNKYLSSTDSEYQYSILLMLSLISTSPLHSELEIISDNTNSDHIEPENFFESDEDSLLDWEKSSSFSEEVPDTIEKEEIVKEIYSEIQAQEKDAPSPLEVEEIIEDETGRIYENPCSLNKSFYESLCGHEKTSNGIFVFPWPYNRTSERDIIDKVIMMLLGLDTDIFVIENSEFKIHKKIEVSHLTPSCLTNTLKFFIDLGSVLYNISLSSETLKKDECLTHQYFGEACHQLHKEFLKTFLSIQEEMAVQSGNTSRKSLSKLPQNTITLISLKNTLYSLYEHAVLIKTATENLSKNPETKTSTLLNYLYTLIQRNFSLTDHSGFCVLIQLFLSSIKPFIEDLCVWLSQGTLSRLDQGFCIQKTDEKKDMIESWESTFIIRKSEGVSTVPVFLRHLESEILTTGKNMMLIRKIEEQIFDHVLPPPSKLLLNLYETLYGTLKQNSSQFYSDKESDNKIFIYPVSWNCNKLTTVDLETVSKFTEFDMDTSSPPKILDPCSFSIPSHSFKHESEPKTLYRPKIWVSFQSILDHSLSNTITQLHNDTCSYLLSLLREKFNLQAYFNSIRDILLMENGECMRNFIKYLNKKANLKESFDNSYELTNIFSESIKSIKHKELCPYFTCEIRDTKSLNSIDSFEIIRINFSPPTPLEIFFDSSTIKAYQKLFTRILQIKRALYCSRSTKWRSREKLVIKVPERKYLVFQKKLIHFTSCFEEYIMQNVLHSCANFFKSEEIKAKSIDELRTIHQKYLIEVLDKSLLSAKTTPLNNAVTAVFNSCIKFFKLTTRISTGKLEEDSTKTKNLFEDIQQNFDTANRILLQVLSKNSQNRRNTECNVYLDVSSYFSMNFNRFYIND
jgi:Gamma tubulin complex component C-terminal